MATRRRKSSSGGKYIILGLIGIIAILAVACGFFYANDRSKKDVGDSQSKGAAKEGNLLDESIEAQRLVDNILLPKDNWQLIENDNGKKNVAVEESGAKVQINQRNLAVGVPTSTSVTGAGDWPKNKIKGI